MFEPVNNAHAIVEMVLFCQFEPELDELTISRLMELEDDTDLNNERTKFQKIQGNQLQMGAPGITSFQIKSVGIEMRRMGPNGEPEWILRTGPHAISVHCLDYTRWDDVGAQARAFLQKVLHKIGATESTLAGLGLKYVDRFSYRGSDEQYDPALLFRQDTTLLHKRAFESKMRWHCHSGWFERLKDLEKEELECLNQVNVDAAFLTVSGARRHMTTIDHNAVVRGLNVENLAAFLASDKDEDALLIRLTEALHLVNKRVLIDLLADEMATRIHLAM
jgi:uncharacterized protein (TIGR04255 family)